MHHKTGTVHFVLIIGQRRICKPDMHHTCIMYLNTHTQHAHVHVIWCIYLVQITYIRRVVYVYTHVCEHIVYICDFINVRCLSVNHPVYLL